MYIPNHFRIDDRRALLDFMAAHSFVALVSIVDGVPVATHLPIVVRPDQGENGTLLGHMARANQQWQHFDTGSEGLVIFQGPHAYVSPSLYETHPAVPTWNYMTVHAYGRPRLVEDEARVRETLRELVGRHEAADGWTIESAEAYVARRLGSIVTFEMPVSRLDGKYKLSQDRDATARGRVIASLLQSTDSLAVAVGRQMQRDLQAHS